MPGRYDDHTYGEMQRMSWRRGIGTSSAVALVTRWYPAGPIEVNKFGARHSVVQAGTELTVTLTKGASASTVATIVCSTTATAWSVSSKASLTQVVGAGSFIAITADGTADTGSLEVWIDYKKLLHNNWVAPQI